MGAVAEEIERIWGLVLKSMQDGNNDWDQVAEVIKETVNTVTVLENINASFLDAFSDTIDDTIGVGKGEVLEYPRHVTQVMQDFDAQLRSRPVQGVEWNGKPFQVMPFISGGTVDVEGAKLAFVDCKKGIWYGEVYLHYAPVVGRVLVSVDGVHFIGCIAIGRTMDALAMIAKGNSGTIWTPAYLNSTQRFIKIGAV